MQIRFCASTEYERGKGLQLQPPLLLQECVWLLLEKLEKVQLWNVNVSFPIKALFCNEKCQVVDICVLPANSSEIYLCQYEVLSVIECNEFYGPVAIGDTFVVKGQQLNFI